MGNHATVLAPCERSCRTSAFMLHVMPEVEFDKTDRAILAELQRNGRIANVDLAEKVNLSPLVVSAPDQGAGGQRGDRRVPGRAGPGAGRARVDRVRVVEGQPAF